MHLITRFISKAVFPAALSCLVTAGLMPAVSAQTQKAAASTGPFPLITQGIDETNLVELKGNVNPVVNSATDQGAVSNEMMLNHMILVLKRSQTQQAALDKFVNDQKNPRSPNYRHWLKPAQFGARFGAASQDVSTIIGWLQSHGFAVESVAKGSNIVIFSGTNAQLQSAFNTSLHIYKRGQVTLYANASNPRIPVALAPVIAGIAQLNNIPLKPAHVEFGAVKRDASTGKWKPVSSAKVAPLFNTPLQGTSINAVGPADLGAIYNFQPLWNNGIDGTGQTIAIVGRSDINPADVDSFRSFFGLSAKKLNILYDGKNPGLVAGDEGEADLDVQWSGAVAPNATIDLVVAASTATTDGIFLSAQYIVDNNIAPIMNVSFGECELGVGTAGNQFINELWEQAASQGISVMVASGDGGSADCDQNQSTAQFGLTVNALASTPYDTAVGGTDLYGTYLNNQAYWNASNDPTTQQSAKGYIPELPWNDSCGNPQILAAFQAQGITDQTEESLCNDFTVSSAVDNTSGGGGGASSCTVSNASDESTCSGGYTKPVWQTGVPGIPTDGVRDLPDVSLFAGNGVWGSLYLYCESDATPDGTCNLTSSNDTQYLAAGGTSFASPNFAGLMALINQKTNSIQGNVDYDLYNLAAKEFGESNNPACDSSTVGNGSACIFYDISQGSNAVPCQAGSTDCTITGASSDFTGVLPGWNAGVGYDTAVGLGSVNAYNLVNAWSTAAASLISTGTTLSLDSTSVPYGAPVTGKIAVSGGASEAASPSGDTSLISASGATGVGFGPFTLSNGEATLSGTGIMAGKYSVAAHYAGDSNFAESTSPATTLTVTQASTNTSLTASRSSVTFGESDTFAVTVATTSKGLSPTGSVTFTNTSTGAVLGVIAVQPQTDADGNAVAVSSVPVTSRNLNQGNNTITAAYSGDSNYVASTATAVTVNYTPPFTLSSGQSSITVTSGKTATATISLVASSGPLPSTVVLSCPNAPAGISCLFSPASFAAGSSSATSTLTINGGFPPASAAIRQGSNGRASMLKTTGGFAASVALALFIVPFRRRRFALRVFVLLFGVTLLSNGCGGGSKNVIQSPVASTTTLQTTPTSGVQGTNFTFSATITGAGSSSMPTGTVSFSDANSVLGMATVTNGTASFATTSLPLGVQSVVASYSGDQHFLPSASSSPVTADVQYQTTVNVTATDSLGNTTSIQLPVIVQ